MANVALFSGTWDPSFYLKLSTGAWSRVYCMARRRNTRNMFAAAPIAILSCHQSISFTGFEAHPTGRTFFFLVLHNSDDIQRCQTTRDALARKIYAL
ncbi:hypothetical protein PoB_002302000 [Plakobranchus ocellatus]|uniref:Uncharacterized protein n=1 Tax=Plakobranchus ocellatus TaxID=259542 RepID=A0AAV3ZLG1_9GAST|nr:hypothetical protein PoB_002302000 [Plakobranchus ocellatus]